MTTSAAVVRKMQDTSMEEEESVKAPRMEEEMPAWAKAISNQISNLKLELSSDLREMKLELKVAVEKYDGLSERVVVLEKKAVDSDDTVEMLAQEVEMLRAENAQLRQLY